MQSFERTPTGSATENVTVLLTIRCNATFHTNVLKLFSENAFFRIIFSLLKKMQTIFLPILIPEFVVKSAEKSLEVG